MGQKQEDTEVVTGPPIASHSRVGVSSPCGRGRAAHPLRALAIPLRQREEWIRWLLASLSTLTLFGNKMTRLTGQSLLFAVGIEWPCGGSFCPLAPPTFTDVMGSLGCRLPPLARLSAVPVSPEGQGHPGAVRTENTGGPSDSFAPAEAE